MASRLGKLSKTRNVAAHPDAALLDDIGQLSQGGASDKIWSQDPWSHAAAALKVFKDMEPAAPPLVESAAMDGGQIDSAQLRLEGPCLA